MSSRSTFSNAIRITDLNDFLTPSATCVLPLDGGALPDTSKSDLTARVEPPGSVLAPIVPVQAPSGTSSTRARVTVSDCLTCSGCVTSADTVLLSTESLDLLKEVMLSNPSQKRNLFTAVALSQQAVASIAVHFGLDLQTTARKLATFLRHQLQFDAVIDLSFARHFSLIEAAEEFVQRFQSGKKLTITSACPGWLTYAEKTQEDSVLQYISNVRSPQGMLGIVAQTFQLSGDQRQIWMCSVMPCHDKKLEAIRPEFAAENTEGVERREVSCVLTAGELVQVLRDKGFDMELAKEGVFDVPFGSKTGVESGVGEKMSTDKFGVAVGSGSGGYADFVLRYAAKSVLGVALPDDPLKMEKASRSGDLQSITVSNQSGTRTLCFALAYGFRSLQSVLRKVRRGESPYNYIELMACPGGCNNGGGQLEMGTSAETEGLSLKQQSNKHLGALNGTFNQAPKVQSPTAVDAVQRVYNEIVRGSPGSVESKRKLGMKIESRTAPPAVTPASLEW
eukprot:GFKZ01011403.1.p1 GENE.GFKZ01011403.1~~GFKZ01011403.1.p1  ORF type:complete len:507 (-),score=66.85 GFKZ01011403.1:1422-2942(-)